MIVSSSFHQFKTGFCSPLRAITFFLRNKRLLVLGLVPHVVFFFVYLWFIHSIVLTRWISPLGNSLAEKWQGSFFSPLFQSTFLSWLVWIVGFLLYGVFGTACVNAIASPVYDTIAQRAYESSSGHKLPTQTFMDFVDSAISECTKAVIIFCFFVISFFVNIFAPVLFLGGIWYLGWNNIDRTLLLMNKSLRQRILFGIKHWSLCLGLGLWCSLPIIGTLFSFAMAAAGALSLSQNRKL